jgi:cobyrinic acid a,c-diamide synthase
VAERNTGAIDSVRASAAMIREGCDLEGLLALARTAPPLMTEAWSASAPSGARGCIDTRLRRGARPATTHPHTPTKPIVAVAGGAAFTFSYAEHTELLEAAGAEVASFDPLNDENLPEGTAALVIGGGFPEVYAPDLSANEQLRKDVATLAGTGAPVVAECAGLLYLARSLDGRMSGRLTLGYRDAVAIGDSVLAPAGTRMRGHEFHRTVLEPGAGPQPAWGMRLPAPRVEGFVQQGVHASYLHTHWAALPDIAHRLVERCLR